MGPTKIVYDEIINEGEYIIGIAHFLHPEGLGEFEISVSGPPDAVESYPQEAVIYALEFVPAAGKDNFQELIKARKKSAEEFQREVSKEEPDPDKSKGDEKLEFNYKRDRLIEFKPVGEYEVGTYYRLSFDIHPKVAQGSKDIYEPSNNNTTYASGAIDAISGIAYLYLYLNGQELAKSEYRDVTHQVVEAGGPGFWRLYVYGYSAATYKITGDWVLKWDG